MKGSSVLGSHFLRAVEKSEILKTMSLFTKLYVDFVENTKSQCSNLPEAVEFKGWGLPGSSQDVFEIVLGDKGESREEFSLEDSEGNLVGSRICRIFEVAEAVISTYTALEQDYKSEQELPKEFDGLETVLNEMEDGDSENKDQDEIVPYSTPAKHVSTLYSNNSDQSSHIRPTFSHSNLSNSSMSPQFVDRQLDDQGFLVPGLGRIGLRSQLGSQHSNFGSDMYVPLRQSKPAVGSGHFGDRALPQLSSGQVVVFQSRIDQYFAKIIRTQQ
ncbi:hypothetical protein AX774_g7781 [Zancudomyces culisetae]|uniref:Uncharacterized protein n=1 Tax=Zancudomyces culisetae TaxID=1213189 RepID=A0A1R1PD14_ZANCU|nr:hypothetical protein AX774_g7781 [Zancudomyces culisetae]|eukprot:OMH78823.1 hypothetical protein AX774_g7781 [Zancudomyces culisetae]